MVIKTGCDLVNIERFQKSAKNGGQNFLDKIFSSYELMNAPDMETLAGVFASKEAITKALSLEIGSWHQIEIIKNESGRPEIKLSNLDQKIVSQDLSISHDGNYAMAMAVFLIG